MTMVIYRSQHTVLGTHLQDTPGMAADDAGAVVLMTFYSSLSCAYGDGMEEVGVSLVMLWPCRPTEDVSSFIRHLQIGGVGY